MQRVEEFRANKNQSVAEVFSNLATAYDEETNLQILVAPDIAERKVEESVFRNMTIERSIYFIAKKNKLSYVQKGNIFVITGSRESIVAFNEELRRRELPIQKPQDHQTERREISQMPVVGQRPEFDIVWEMKKELEELRKRVAILEESGANQSTQTTQITRP